MHVVEGWSGRCLQPCDRLQRCRDITDLTANFSVAQPRPSAFIHPACDPYLIFFSQLSESQIRFFFCFFQSDPYQTFPRGSNLDIFDVLKYDFGLKRGSILHTTTIKVRQTSPFCTNGEPGKTQWWYGEKRQAADKQWYNSALEGQFKNQYDHLVVWLNNLEIDTHKPTGVPFIFTS